jgi:hypothetical protein
MAGTVFRSAALTFACLFGLNSAAPGFAGALSESATCAVDNPSNSVTTQTGTTGCAAVAGSAYANGAVELSGFGSALSSSIRGEAAGEDNIDSLAEFSGTLDYSEAFSTAGAVRPGFLQYSVALSPDKPYDGSVSAGLRIGDYATFSTSGYTGASESSIIAVTLGIPFTFTLDESAQILSAPGEFDGFVGGGITASVSFGFFEADGATPVAVLDSEPAAITPEPGTITIIGPALIGLFSTRRHLTLGSHRRPQAAPE